MKLVKFFTLLLVASLAWPLVANAKDVTLDYHGGSRSTIRGTNDTVDVRSTTGVIDLKDRDLIKACDCRKTEKIVCDPAIFDPNSANGTAQKSECKCVSTRKPGPITGVRTAPLSAFLDEELEDEKEEWAEEEWVNQEWIDWE